MSSVSRSLILTCHGSFVCFDRRDGSLVHRPQSEWSSDIRPAMSYVFVDTESGQLSPKVRIFDGDSSDKELGKEYLLDITPGQRKVHFKLADRFFSANVSGSISCDRPSTDLWESFIFIPAHEFEQLNGLIKNDFVFKTSGEIIHTGECDYEKNFEFRMGAWSFDLTKGHPLIDIKSDKRAADTQNETLSYVLVKDGWKIIDELSIIKPLIYYVAFGSEEIFQQLYWSLRSLAEVAHYKGDIHIISDKPREFIQNYIPAPFNARFATQHCPAVDYIDYAFARYSICDSENARKFQPILYSDTDIAFDKDLLSLFADVIKNEKLHVAAETFSSRREKNSAGAYLFHESETDVGESYGVNSGAFAISSLAKGEHYLRLVRKIGSSYFALAGRTLTRGGDQPFMNYCGFVLDFFDTDLMTPLVRVGQVDSSVEQAERTGLIHFWPHKGQAAKLESMKKYVEACLSQGET